MRARTAVVVGVITLASLAAIALLAIKSWATPILGPEDTPTLEYFGWFVEHHVSFGALGARLALRTDDVFYPYGTLAAMLPWGFERDLFYAALHASFGAGPWLQLYVVLANAAAALGVYLALRAELGPPRAAFVAFASTMMAFYTFMKWPHHMNLCGVHWMLVGLAMDYVLARRLVRGARVATPWLLVRAAVLLQLFGLDLGYVAGFGLAGATLTALFTLALLARRRAFSLVRPSLAELHAAPRVSLAAALLALMALYLYVPLDAQVALASRELGFADAGGSFWASQARVLFPYLPGVDPSSALVARVFGSTEGTGELQVGWFLLALFALGLFDARRARALLPLAPTLALLALAFAFHPSAFPTLRVFPWLKFDRVAGRATLLMPFVMALVATSIDVTRRRRLLLALVPLGLVELATGWWVVARAPGPTPVPADLAAYERAIRDTPGRALFEWPFCVTGGNGVGGRELCPFYARNATLYSLRRLHGKKVIGQYFSRLAPSQMQPFVDAGWPSLFSPDDPDPHRARAQTRCFDDPEWRFVEDMLAYGDFAGMALYPALVPPGCADAIHARLGAPIASTTLDGVGRAEFIPTPARLRGRAFAVDPRALRVSR